MFTLTGKIAKKASRLVYRKIEYRVAFRSLQDFEAFAGKTDLQFTIMTEKDLIEIEKKFGKKISEKFAKRLKNSNGCVVSDQDGICGYVWWSIHHVPGEGIRPFLFDIHPKRGFAYIYDLYILPGKRRLALIFEFCNYLGWQIKKAGYKDAFYIFDKQNVVMERVIALKFGLKIDGELTYRRLAWRVHKDTSALRQFCQLSQVH